MLLIISSCEDAHVKQVSQYLDAWGKTYQVLDFASLLTPHCPADTLQFNTNADFKIALAAQTPLDLTAITTVWYRRPSWQKLAELFSWEMDNKLTLNEWRITLNAILDSINARFVNQPLQQKLATKPRQLLAAQQAGLTIPATLITNNTLEARRFIDKLQGRVIHKVLGTSPEQRFLATKRWSETDAGALEQLHKTPVLFQQEITGAKDLRVTVMGDRLFAAAFDSTYAINHEGIWIDNRLNLDVPYTEYKLPAAIQAGILATMRTLGLVFGTVDLKIDESGQPIFLEINPQGQFLYVEILTGMPLAKSMAEFLTQS